MLNPGCPAAEDLKAQAQGPCKLWLLPASRLHSRLGLALQALGPVSQLQRTRTDPRGHQRGPPSRSPACPPSNPALCRAPPASKPSPWVAVGRWEEGPQLPLSSSGILRPKRLVAVEWMGVEEVASLPYVTLLCASSNLPSLSFAGHEPGE